MRSASPARSPGGSSPSHEEQLRVEGGRLFHRAKIARDWRAISRSSRARISERARGRAAPGDIDIGVGRIVSIGVDAHPEKPESGRRGRTDRRLCAPPTPPVKASTSSPPSVAAIAAIPARSRCR